MTQSPVARGRGAADAWREADGRGLWNSGPIRLTNRPTNQPVYRRLARIAAAKAVSMKSLMRE
jgi:hypothetical protein